MLDKNSTALIFIDIQEKLFRLMHQKEALLRSCKQMIAGAKTMGLPMVWAEQYPQGMGPTLPELADLMDGQPISKKCFSCWAHPDLRQAIQNTGCQHFLLMGIETHICVAQSACDLIQKGYQVHVLKDCVSSRTLENKNLGIQRVRKEGGTASSVEMSLFEMLGAAEGESFQNILSIIK
jgi:nicotinamidase-related amidase